MDAKGRAFAFLTFHLNPPVMQEDDLVHQGQPEPRALRLRRVERKKNLVEPVTRDSQPRVSHPQFQFTATAVSRHHRCDDLKMPAIGHRFNSVLHKVAQCLAHENFIHGYLSNVRGTANLNAMGLRGTLDPYLFHYTLEPFRKRDGPEIEFG